MIIGPPGTGKTTTLLSILEKELMTYDASRIAYVSYTRKGAYEGRDRARDTMKLKIKDLPFFRTLHSIAYRQAGMTPGGMVEDNRDKLKRFSELLGMKFRGYYTEDFTHNDDRYLFFDFLHRNNPKIAVDYLMDMDTYVLKWVRSNYRKFKNVSELKDYTDIIEDFVADNKPLPVDIAIIDEAQDLTTLQWNMIWIAFQNCKRVYIAGDDDQAIYEWAGADVDYFLRIKAEQRILKKSYRLPDKIHAYSELVAHHINTRIEKDFEPNGNEGEVHRIMNYKNVPVDNGESWLFLSRNNYFLKPVEQWLKDEGYVYSFKGKSSVSPSIYKAIHKHAAMSKEGAERTSGDRQMVSFFCGTTPTYEKPWYEEFTKLKPETLTYFRRLLENKTEIKDPRITISTIHGIKGGEADNVVLILDVTSAVYKNMQSNNDAEMRCYYVGITRARKRLYLVEPTTRFRFPIFGEV